MGVYIKNMEMPVTCCHCPLMGYDPDIECVDGGRETQGAYICVITHELIDSTKREEHCPLIPVPPHGRLIDADALYEDCALDYNYDVAATTTRINEYMQLKIDAAHTIIPTEEGE